MSIEHTIPPLRDLPAGRLEVRKEHLVAEILRGRHHSRRFSLPRLVGPRRRVAAFALALALVVIGTAVAATRTDWLTGSPAPTSVVSDFGSYAPQLGFDPEPGRAVLVAKDGEFSLYATTNTQGSYCLVASAPWKRPSELPDGGTCIAPAQAAAPLIAGLVGASGSRSPGRAQQTYLIAGRTADPEARMISFTGPGGDPITRAIGSSGFFIAAVRTDESACTRGDWTSRFSGLGADGKERTHATITLATAPPDSARVCVFAAPHP
jgi:hypothetical protein